MRFLPFQQDDQAHRFLRLLAQESWKLEKSILWECAKSWPESSAVRLGPCGTGLGRSRAGYLNRGMFLPVVDTGFWNSAPDGYDLSGHSPQRVKPIFW